MTLKSVFRNQVVPLGIVVVTVIFLSVLTHPVNQHKVEWSIWLYSIPLIFSFLIFLFERDNILRLRLQIGCTVMLCLVAVVLRLGYYLLEGELWGTPW